MRKKKREITTKEKQLFDKITSELALLRKNFSSNSEEDNFIHFFHIVRLFYSELFSLNYEFTFEELSYLISKEDMSDNLKNEIKIFNDKLTQMEFSPVKFKVKVFFDLMDEFTIIFNDLLRWKRESKNKKIIAEKTKNQKEKQKGHFLNIFRANKTKILINIRKYLIEGYLALDESNPTKAMHIYHKIEDAYSRLDNARKREIKPEMDDFFNEIKNLKDELKYDIKKASFVSKIIHSNNIKTESSANLYNSHIKVDNAKNNKNSEDSKNNEIFGLEGNKISTLKNDQELKVNSQNEIKNSAESFSEKITNPDKSKKSNQNDTKGTNINNDNNNIKNPQNASFKINNFSNTQHHLLNNELKNQTNDYQVNRNNNNNNNNKIIDKYNKNDENNNNSSFIRNEINNNNNYRNNKNNIKEGVDFNKNANTISNEKNTEINIERKEVDSLKKEVELMSNPEIEYNNYENKNNENRFNKEHKQLYKNTDNTNNHFKKESSNNLGFIINNRDYEIKSETILKTEKDELRKFNSNNNNNQNNIEKLEQNSNNRINNKFDQGIQSNKNISNATIDNIKGNNNNENIMNKEDNINLIDKKFIQEEKKELNQLKTPEIAPIKEDKKIVKEIEKTEKKEKRTFGEILLILKEAYEQLKKRNLYEVIKKYHECEEYYYKLNHEDQKRAYPLIIALYKVIIKLRKLYLIKNYHDEIEEELESPSEIGE